MGSYAFLLCHKQLIDIKPEGIEIANRSSATEASSRGRLVELADDMQKSRLTDQKAVAACPFVRAPRGCPTKETRDFLHI